jgi:elongation factor Tu
MREADLRRRARNDGLVPDLARPAFVERATVFRRSRVADQRPELGVSGMAACGWKADLAPFEIYRQNPGMPDDQVRVRASIRFLFTEEGGRSSPLSGGGRYTPNHNFFGPDDRDMCIGLIELPEGRQVAPGDTIQTEMTLWIYPAVKAVIGAGRQWRIQEGGNLVAVGKILEVLDPIT